MLIWLDVEEREESNDTKIIFIALSTRKLLTQSARPTQHDQATCIVWLVRYIKEGGEEDQQMYMYVHIMYRHL